jgi:hypothetical protein
MVQCQVLKNQTRDRTFVSVRRELGSAKLYPMSPLSLSLEDRIQFKIEF